MKAIQDVIAAKTIPPKMYREILDEVLKSTNHAHVAGVGRQLAGMGNLDSGRSQPDTGYYTQERLEDLKRQHALEIKEQRKAFESQENVLKKFMDFFNRQQGTPSQFQIPDLYTHQVFTNSISTPGGPSFTSPAPRSTPLDLGNCYIPTFDPETSQSGEEDDNDSDDDNREYDAEMKAIQDVIAAKTILPKTYREIFDEVLKSTNHAHVAGVGRQLAGMGNLDSGRSQPDTVFSSSISTPGGPSFTSPAPRSTPFDIGNCYTPTFNPETSQSGEEDDNGSDDVIAEILVESAATPSLKTI
nr:hypothetical protein [Tanacetum cinerariifolium]